MLAFRVKALASVLIYMYNRGGNSLNFGGYKKSATGGLILGGFKGAKLSKDFLCEILNFFRMIGTIILQIGGKFPKIFALFSNGTIFVYFFSHFAQIGCTVFKATFCIGSFWRQKVKRG